MDKHGLGDESQKAIGMSILIAGKNTFGYTGDGTKLPEFDFIKINESSTGLVKQPIMTIEVENLRAEFITHMASGLPFVLKSTLHEEDELPLLITAQGDLHKMGSDVKVGDNVKRTFELKLNMYTEMVDNLPTVVYTRKPYNLVLGGIDKAPDFNKYI